MFNPQLIMTCINSLSKILDNICYVRVGSATASFGQQGLDPRGARLIMVDNGATTAAGHIQVCHVTHPVNTGLYAHGARTVKLGKLC